MEHLELFKTHCQPEFNEIKSGIDRIEEAINGNGADRLKSRQARTEERLDTLSKRWTWIFSIMTGIIIVSLAAYFRYK